MKKEALLQRLLLKFEEAGFSKYKQYNRFEYVDRSASTVTIRRQKGTTAAVPYKKLLHVISLFYEDRALYDEGQTGFTKPGSAMYPARFIRFCIWRIKWNTESRTNINLQQLCTVNY